MNEIKRAAYAKINLALDVIRKREDGYHEVKMIMQTVDICDELTFTKTEGNQITLSVDDSTIPSNQDNLIYQAAKLLLEETNTTHGVHISLQKTIPVAAGMAGGSSDAAATLLGLNELFELGKTEEELRRIGVEIGADVPYCIMGGTALSEGIGEILTPLLPPPNPYVLIAKPDLFVSTQYVYSNLKVDQLPYHPNVERMITSIQQGELYSMCEDMQNVLETVTIPVHPIIEQIKCVMKDHGAITSLMSGSGPTVFGIYESQSLCQEAYDAICATGMAKEVFQTRFL